MLYPSGPIIIPRQSCRHPTWGGASDPAQHPLTRQNKTFNNTVGPNICWCFKAWQSLRLATITLLCLLSPLPTTTILVNDHHNHINITNALLIGTITCLKHTRSSFSRVSSPSLQTKYFRSSHTIFKLHLSARFALQVVNFVQRQILHNQGYGQVHRRIIIKCFWKSGIERKK